MHDEKKPHKIKRNSNLNLRCIFWALFSQSRVFAINTLDFILPKIKRINRLSSKAKTSKQYVIITIDIETTETRGEQFDSSRSKRNDFIHRHRAVDFGDCANYAEPEKIIGNIPVHRFLFGVCLFDFRGNHRLFHRRKRTDQLRRKVE